MAEENMGEDPTIPGTSETEEPIDQEFYNTVRHYARRTLEIGDEAVSIPSISIFDKNDSKNNQISVSRAYIQRNNPDNFQDRVGHESAWAAAAYHLESVTGNQPTNKYDRDWIQKKVDYVMANPNSHSK